jgi:hypothetical protein
MTPEKRIAPPPLLREISLPLPEFRLPERWLSGRKQRFAKASYLKRVPRVRIPLSPPVFRHGGKLRPRERREEPEERVCGAKRNGNRRLGRSPEAPGRVNPSLSASFPPRRKNAAKREERRTRGEGLWSEAERQPKVGTQSRGPRPSQSLSLRQFSATAEKCGQERGEKNPRRGFVERSGTATEGWDAVPRPPAESIPLSPPVFRHGGKMRPRERREEPEERVCGAKRNGNRRLGRSPEAPGRVNPSLSASFPPRRKNAAKREERRTRGEGLWSIFTPNGATHPSPGWNPGSPESFPLPNVMMPACALYFMNARGSSTPEAWRRLAGG